MLAVFVLNSRVGAAVVSAQSAQTVALNFFKFNVPAAANNSSLSLSLDYTQTETDGTIDFYVFNVSPMKGFVIVSADDNAIPVIAYSSESNFNTNMNDLKKFGMSDWMKSSAIKIHYVVTNHIQADANIQSLWSSYTRGINPQSSRAATIGPLLTTTWNQNPYYNALCPPAALSSLSNSKAVTGCVATAMAQIMKYWNYPAKGTGGSISYNDDGSCSFPTASPNYGTLTTNLDRTLNWSAMPNNVSSATDPVDSLMYELGVVVHMCYDSTGSGAYVLSSESGGGPCSQTVFPNNFYYNPNTIQGVQLSSYSTADWITLLEGEINAGRVVQYEGDDPTAGGHTWVMDGYEPQSGGDLLHMNWGWGGAYDGWFSVTNLSTPGFDPSQNDAALIGIQPLAPFSLTLTPTSPTICPNSAGTTLSAQGPAGATYTWTPATGLSCTSCASTVATPTTTTLYTVKVDSAGVIGTASTAVTVTAPVVPAFSFTATATCTLPENVSFTNTTTNALSYVWDFGDGSATSTDANPLHAYTSDGSYTVKLYATNTCGVDSLIRRQAVVVSGGAPTAPSVSICTGQTATLNATGGDVYWYSDAAGQNAMQQGNTYTTPPLGSTITYYVGSVISPSPVVAGPATDAIGASSNYNTSSLRGMVFNNTVAQTLNTVVVYATGAGPRLFELQDASGNILDSMTVNLVNGQQTVLLGFSVPVGNNLLLAINGVANLLRNSAGAVFPYTSSDGTVSITGNNAGAAGRYYFFYDWQLQQNSCTTSINPVTVYVLNSGGYSFTATGTGSPTVSFTPATTDGTSYLWNFGDGSATSSLVSPTHTYPATGTYTVQLIVSNGNCADTVTRSINTTLAGINDISVLSGLTVFPNPAKDQLSVSVNSSKEFSDCKLQVSNILGQSTYSQDVNLSSGANKFDINIAALSPGIYFISLQNGKDTVTARFVKASE